MAEVDLWDDYVAKDGKKNPTDNVATAITTGAANDSATLGGGGSSTEVIQRQVSGKRALLLALVAIAAVSGLSLGLAFGLRWNNADTPVPASSVVTANNDATSSYGPLFRGKSGKPKFGSDVGASSNGLDGDINPEENKDNIQGGGDFDENETASKVIPNLGNTESTGYYRSEGPLLAQVKMISPSVANGYETCSDLETDISEALKHYANQVIMEQSVAGEIYASCDPNNPNWELEYYGYNYGYYYGYGYYGYDDDDEREYDYHNETNLLPWDDEESHAEPKKHVKAARNNHHLPTKKKINPFLTKDAKRSGHPSPDKRSKSETNSRTKDSPEDSFHANNQVDGVDSADVVKSDGTFVFAAYGDILYAWEANDGTAGVSITAMPGNETDCYGNYWYYDDMNYWYYDDDDSWWNITRPTAFPEGPSAANVSSSQKKRHHKQGKRKQRRAEDGSDLCTYVSKPRVQSLLLNGKRLTAIVVQDSYLYTYPENYTTPIVSDYQILSVRVYDINEVPKDGSPLKEVGYKEISGDFFNGRSVGDTALIVTSSYIDTYAAVEDLHRYQPEYCGLNTSEYIKQAAETATNTDFDALAKQIVIELQLENDCSNIFQISMMQEVNNNSSTSESGGSIPDLSGGNLMNKFISIASFDMSADFGTDGNIPVHLSGTFTPGAYLSSLYVTEDFVFTVNQGYSYDYTTGESSDRTYILGFHAASGTTFPFCVGNVPGSIVNEYSIGQWDGHLHVATTDWRWSDFNSTTLNQIFVLKIPDDDDGPVMEVAGETGHLGKSGESIYAVRFFDDTAFVVTFEQVDPFIIVDLSDHTTPQSVGELEVPGFSTYLHPIEIDAIPYILSIGEEWDEDGNFSSSKLTLFDVSNVSLPLVAATHLEKGAFTNAQYDFQALRYLPESKTLVIPQSKYNYDAYDNEFEGFVVYGVSKDEIKPLFNISQDDYSCSYEAYIPARSFVFESKLTTIMGHTALSTNLNSMENDWELDLCVY